MIRYAKPTIVDEALALLGEGPWRILAGGTDFYPAQGSKPFRENVLDINGLAALRGIAETESHWVIGARTTWTDLVRHPLPAAFDALKQGAREVGSVQIQNVASMAGNLCNASPAADGVPPLLVLDAEVELRSASDNTLPAAGTIHPRQSPHGFAAERNGHGHPRAETRNLGDVSLHETRRPALSRHFHCHGGSTPCCRERYRQQRGRRRRLLFGGRQTPRRRRSRLARLAGKRLGLPKRSCPRRWPSLSPIGDVRGSAEYRLDAARELVARAVLGRRADDHVVAA